MAQDYKTVKSYRNFGGLNLAESDLLRSDAYATDTLNVDLRDTKALNKRTGYQAKGSQKGGGGMTKFANVDTTTGIVTDEVIVLDDNLHHMKKSTVQITYSGSNPAYYDFYLNESDGRFYLDLYDNYVRVLNFDCGVGVDEATPTSILAMITAISAVTDFSAATSGTNTVPAAFCDISRNIDLPTGIATDLDFWEFDQITSSVTNPFSTSNAKVEDIDHEVASFVQLNNVLYIATSDDELYKYDGSNVYRAGMPQGEITSATVGAAGVLNSTYYYKTTYEFTDAKGNIIEGIISDSVTAAPASQKVDVVVDNIVTADNTGFLSTSTDLKINLWRSKAGATSDDTTYYLVTTLTNNGGAATQSYEDNIADGSLGAAYVQPIKPHGLPPKGRYLAAFRNQLIIAGKADDVNGVYYSDIDSPEYFPAGDNQFNVETRRGDIVTGIYPFKNTLFVFKERSIHALTGDLAEDKFRVDLATQSDIGCSAHATIEEVEGALFFLSDKGVYSINETDLVHVSEPIKQKFKEVGSQFIFKKAVALHWTNEDKYLIHMPSESTFSGSIYNDSDSRIFAYDYHRQAWLEWDTIDFAGGATLVDNEFWFTNRVLDSTVGGTQVYTCRISLTGDEQSFADHNQPISFRYKAHWEALGEPSVFKKFLRIRVHSLDTSVGTFETGGFNLDTSAEVNYLDGAVSDFTLDFIGGASGWGTFAWGSAPWGSTRLYGAKHKLKTGKHRAIRIVFENAELHRNVLISGYDLEVVAPFQIRIKE